VWRTDRWIAVRSANRDPDFRNTKRVSDADFDLLVRNVYKCSSPAVCAASTCTPPIRRPSASSSGS
jgi:hypothetical protein